MASIRGQGQASGFGVPVALAMLGGLAFPLGWGSLVAVLVVGVALGFARDRSRTRDPGPDRPDEIALGLQAVGTAIVVGFAARVVADGLVTFPAAWWSIPALVVAGLVTAWTSRRRVGPILVVGMALLIPVAGVWGAAFEARGVDARGWAFSGRIHGIHPFQATSIAIDDFGPFDLPFNDYVEPNGSRGYGPGAFAAALQLALQRIAEVHFGAGPVRARIAFEDAQVGVVWDPPLAESWDETTGSIPVPRFYVRSGTTGQRSSVRFECPGQVIEPGGPERSRVLDLRCPNKYATEASAGLGVLGRWPGYAEGRGNERLGLARAFGFVRSEDTLGRRVIAWEVRVLAVMGIVVVLGLALRFEDRVHHAVQPSLGVLCVLGGAMLAVVLLGGEGSSTGPRPIVGAPIPIPDPWSGSLPLLLLLWGAGSRPSDGVSTVMGRVWAVTLGIVASVGWLVDRSRVAWLFPAWSARAGRSWQDWVEGFADLLAEATGASVMGLEGAIAASTVALGLGLIVSMLGGFAKRGVEQVTDHRSWMASGGMASGGMASGRVVSGAALMAIAVSIWPPDDRVLLFVACAAMLAGRIDPGRARWKGLGMALVSAGILAFAVRGAHLGAPGWICTGMVALLLVARATFWTWLFHRPTSTNGSTE